MCPHCLQPAQFSLPIHPVYSLDVAEEIVPITHSALTSILQRARLPKRYIKDEHRRRHRMLSAQEIRYIRSQHFLYNDANGERRQADPEGL